MYGTTKNYNAYKRGPLRPYIEQNLKLVNMTENKNCYA